MAVRIQNEANIRKAKRWDEKDDAALALIMKKKVKEVDLAMKEAETPYIRARLKAQKAHYKKMSRKIANGTYNGDVIFGEMQAAAALRAEQQMSRANYSTVSGARKYLNSYEDMDFDYETYFRKKRYFGITLPLILILLTVIFLGFYLIGAFLPTETKAMLSNDYNMKLDTLFYFKLGTGSQDFRVKNDGNWPDGDWKYVGGTQKVLEQGVPFVAEDGTTPEFVNLYADLGMRTVNISAFDIVKAWFRTPMLASTRIDFIEDNSHFQGASWFYSKYIASQADAIKIQKNADGKYDITSIIKHISVYGTIIFLIIAFILGIVALITCFVRLFTYTTRKVHLVNVFALICSVLVLVLPGFLIMEGTDIATAFSNYFVFDHATFMQDKTLTLMMNPLALIAPGVMILSMILPLIFKNRLKRRPTFVPKGNKARRAR